MAVTASAVAQQELKSLKNTISEYKKQKLV